MTLHDLGSEHPIDPSDTRKLVERERTEAGIEVGNRAFSIGLLVVVVVLVGFAVVLWMVR